MAARRQNRARVQQITKKTVKNKAFWATSFKEKTPGDSPHHNQGFGKSLIFHYVQKIHEMIFVKYAPSFSFAMM